VRLFVAADIPDEVRQAIEVEVVEALRDELPGARWTRPEGRHLTLKFLGNVADERVGDVAAAVGSATRGGRRFEASLAEIGAFPDPRRARVLWIGIGDGFEEFAALAAALDASLAPLGFVPEQRPFRCHLTLARFKVPQVVAVERSVPERSFAVDEIVLFRSHLHPKGARYEALARFPLEQTGRTGPR